MKGLANKLALGTRGQMSGAAVWVGTASEAVGGRTLPPRKGLKGVQCRLCGEISS